MLEDVYKSYRKLADEVSWKKYNINELFFKTIEYENTDLYEKYYAGVICRVWGYSGKVFRSVNRHIPFDQCYDIVIDAVNYVLSKRVWESENSSLYGDKSAPDKAFHIALRRQRSIILSSLTADKRQSNFNNLSIDSFREEYNDASDGLLIFNQTEYSDNTKIRSLITHYFDHNYPVKGFALDFICFGNSDQFSTDRIIKQIKEINCNEYNYYNLVYGISKQQYNRYVNEIKHTSKQIINYQIKGLLYELRKEYVNA